jgi:hypothetical protein
MRSILLLSFVYLNSLHVLGQSILTKQEIVDKWMVCCSNNHKNDSTLFSWDYSLEKRLVHLTDSLQSNGIDSFIIYVESLPGHISTNQCVKYIYPEYAYLLWQGLGKTHIRKIVGQCEISFSVSFSSAFNFWSDNGEIIKTEILMPVILKAELSKEGLITYLISTKAHDPKYLLFLKSSSEEKWVRFDKNTISNEEGLFYEDNLKSKSIELWRRIEVMLKSTNIL